MRSSVFGLVSLAVIAACGSSQTNDGDPASMQDAGIDADAGGDVVQPPVGCDPAADPKDAPKCVVSDYGVFVAAFAQVGARLRENASQPIRPRSADSSDLSRT